MHRTSILVGTLGALLASAALHAQTAAGDVEGHVAAARAAAGQEHRATFVNLCLPAAPRGAGPGGAAAGPRAGGPPATPDRANWYASPYKVFDNLYWLGTRQHSSWALRTSAGIIIIDTNFAWATQPEIIDGLTALGLDPRDIKYVFISHAHGDHDQGAAELQRALGAKVVMGAADWEATLKRPATAPGGVPTRGHETYGRARGHENHAGRYHRDHRADTWPHAGDAVVCLPGEGSGTTVMVALLRRHADGRVRQPTARDGMNTSPRRRELPASRPKREPPCSSRTTASTTAPTRRRGWCRSSASRARTIHSSSVPTASSAISR